MNEGEAICQFRWRKEEKARLSLWCKQQGFDLSTLFRLVGMRILALRQSFPLATEDPTTAIEAATDDVIGKIPIFVKQREINPNLYR